jgi:hypothetical protein
MRQWNHIERAMVAMQLERPAYDFVELRENKKLGDRKFTNRDDELWSQEVDFIIHPA